MDRLLSIAYMSPKIWRITPHPLYEEGRCVLKWGVLLNTVKGGTKHQRTYLISSARGFLYEYIRRAEASGGKLSPGTILRLYAHLRAILIWMADRNIWRLSSATPADVHQFISERCSKGGRSAEGSVQRTVQAHLSLFTAMWELRASYIASLRFDPMSYEVIAQLSVNAKQDNKWLPVEERKAIFMLREALGWIDEVGSAVLRLCSATDINRYPVGMVTKNRRQYVESIFISADRRPDAKFLRNRMNIQDGSFRRVLEQALSETLGAAVLSCLLLSGMRIGELLTLRSGCISVVRPFDGVEYCYLNGIGAKMGGRHANG